MISGNVIHRSHVSVLKTNCMRHLLFAILFLLVSFISQAQRPCTSAEYRQFDFWIGEWEVYGLNGQKAGDSKISLILDSCIILEEWTSASISRGVRFAGKSFNTYNSRTKQWQQTWVDNVGGSTEYLKGQLEKNTMVFSTHPFPFSKDTMATRRLSFTPLSQEKIRQHAEITKDNGKSWATEYDLEYRRKK
jgi:Protein of unknown function (DUF1579)